LNRTRALDGGLAGGVSSESPTRRKEGAAPALLDGK
jgi:hypothetical protein